jgi:hypothetical protein
MRPRRVSPLARTAPVMLRAEGTARRLRRVRHRRAIGDAILGPSRRPARSGRNPSWRAPAACAGLWLAWPLARRHHRTAAPVPRSLREGRLLCAARGGGGKRAASPRGRSRPSRETAPPHYSGRSPFAKTRTVGRTSAQSALWRSEAVPARSEASPRRAELPRPVGKTRLQNGPPRPAKMGRDWPSRRLGSAT